MKRVIKAPDTVSRVSHDTEAKFRLASMKRQQAYKHVATAAALAKTAHYSKSNYGGVPSDAYGISDVILNSIKNHEGGKLHADFASQIDRFYTHERTRGETKRDAAKATAKASVYYTARHGIAIGAAKVANNTVRYAYTKYVEPSVAVHPTLVGVGAFVAGRAAYQHAYKSVDNMKTRWNKGKKTYKEERDSGKSKNKSVWAGFKAGVMRNKNGKEV